MVFPVQTPSSAHQHQVLDPRTLGRPVHLLAGFAKRFGADLSDFLRLGLNRRYGTQFEVGEAMMARTHQPNQPNQPEEAQRWKVYGSSVGRIGLALDRSLVLRVLHCRYGLREGQEDGGDLGAVPVTATEMRLAQKLGLQLVTALVSRIREGLTHPGASPALAAADDFSWLAESASAVGPWTLKLCINEPSSGLQAGLLFSLDEAWMRELLNQLAAERAAPREAPPSDARPLAGRLQVRLVAQLLQRRMSLGEILDIRVGDTIPVSLQATDVLVKDARLFTATVAEHKGKLWLTAFNDTL